MAVALVVLLVLPGQASAQFGPFPPQSEDYGPGITVSGIGFAPLGHRDHASSRAVADARHRAEAIASAVGVSLGGARAVELDTPFEPRPACAHSQRGRCAPLDAVSVEVTFEIVGGPASDEGARKVTGTGTAQAPVDAPHRTSPSIRHGLRAARLAATPLAADAARANAQSAANGSGTTLGALFSIVDATNQFGYGYEPVLGTFGPGQFCGFVRRARLRVDPDTGRRHVVRLPRRLRCFSPKRVTVRLEAEYLAG
ncbi:MAG: uncharacterized protein QOE69_497 [Thermoleophilaceae bacterium]|jgi:hypothetical protein|nr:uncharacterized protein [Thermoleophilaceae bacterium]